MSARCDMQWMPLVKGGSEMAEFVRTFTSEQMAERGRKGGLSRSEAKRAAARENARKAIEKRKNARAVEGEVESGEVVNAGE